MFNHLQSPLLNSVKSQLQLIKHVLTNPSRQLSVKQARLPLGSKNTSVQICQLHKKNPLLTSGSWEYDDFWENQKMHAVIIWTF